MYAAPAQRLASGRHRPRPFDTEPSRPADISASYRADHPGRIRAVGRRETREQREKLARRTAAHDRFLADANRGGGRPLVVPA